MPRTWIAQHHEADAVAALLADFRTHYGSDWPSDNAFAAIVDRLMDDPKTEFILGAPGDDSPPAAVCQLRYRLSVWTAADDCWLEDLFVAEAARGSGLGRAMVGFALERARERGCRRIELDVDADNAPARGLYEAMGFGAKHGGALFMQRPIPENLPEDRR